MPESLADEEGPWKLLAWLDQIQPPLQFGNLFFPSYQLRLILQNMLENKKNGMPYQEAIQALLEVAGNSLKAEEDHLLRAVNTLLENARTRLDEQLEERLDFVDTFFEGLSLADETEQLSPRQAIEELSTTLRLPLRISTDQARLMNEDPDELKSLVYDQIRSELYAQSITRLLGAVERRLEETLNLDPNQLPAEDWDTLDDQVLDSIQAAFEARRSRLLGESGQLTRDLEGALNRTDGRLGSNTLLQLLMSLPQGSRAAFDKKTHRRFFQRTTRFTYVYYAAKLLEGRLPEETTEDVLNHLERAQSAIRQAWGEIEWNRIAESTLPELDSTTQKGLQEVLDDETYQLFQGQALKGIPRATIPDILQELGRQALTEIYRQLLLGVITELWVEYLTQMEALRVSIGLEAYAQRDPLVQYKNRAFGLFQELLDNMRSGVVTRMFTYRPRDLSSVQTTVTRLEATPVEVEASTPGSDGGNGSGAMEPENDTSATKSRRRRRKRR